MAGQKRMAKTLISSLILFLLLGPGTSWTHLCICNAEAYVSPGDFYAPGELSVQVINVPDTTAPVELDIYKPVPTDTYPLVIFQHGFTGSIKGYETISTHLASHGFVVVLPQMYPAGGSGYIPTPEEEAALGVQIIAWLEANINTIVAPVTADTSLLGLSGHSRGGQIAYRMALQVPEKVDALAGVDPVDGLVIFGQTLVITGPLSFDIPTYILGTGLGPIVVGGFLACAPEEIGPFHFYCASPNPTWLAVAITHGHADMIDEEDYSDFCPGGPDRDGMRAFTAGTCSAFFSGILQGNENALSVLSDPESAPVPATMEMNKAGNDTDADAACDVCDNCPVTPNGSALGTCVKNFGTPPNDVVVGVGASLTSCDLDSDCGAGEICQLTQGDSNGNGCGDACECYADISGTGGKVDLTDLVTMKGEFAKPCPPSACTADLNDDNKVDLTDLVIMKTQFLRTGCGC